MFLYEIHFVVDDWLRLAPSKSFYMKLGEEVAYLKVRPQHGIRAVSYKGSLNVDMDPRSDDDEAQYTFDLEHEAAESHKASGLSRIRGSHLFTEFHLYVYWPKAMNSNETTGESIVDRLVEYSNKWLKYFFEMYGLFMGSLELTPSNQAKMIFPAITLFENGAITPDGITGSRTSNVRYKGIGGNLAPKLKTVPQQTIQQLEAHLKLGYSIDLTYQLILDARDQVDVFQRYDLAIVIAGTAFEVFLKKYLVTLCNSKNLERLKVGKGKKSKEVRFNEYAEKANPMELLSVIQTVIGVNIKGGRYHSDWYSKAYEPRNDIVHRGVNTFTAEAAAKAIEVVQSYANYITSVSR